MYVQRCEASPTLLPRHSCHISKSYPPLRENRDTTRKRCIGTSRRITEPFRSAGLFVLNDWIEHDIRHIQVEDVINSSHGEPL